FFQRASDVRHLGNGQMFTGAGGGFGHGRSDSRGPALRNDDAVGARSIRSTENRAQVVWIFHAVEHDYQGKLASLGCYYVVEIVILLARSDGNHALMGVISGHAIEFRARDKPHGHSLAAALVHHTLQTQVVAFFGNAYPFKGASTSFQ